MFGNVSALNMLVPLIFFSQHPLLAQSFTRKLRCCRGFSVGFTFADVIIGAFFF